MSPLIHCLPSRGWALVLFVVLLLDPLHHEPSHHPQDEDGVVCLPDEEAVFSQHRILQL